MTAATVQSIIGDFKGILETLLPILGGLALVYFVWGIVQFIAKSGDETARTEGKRKMLWGIIALFVIVSVWGLVGIIGDSFKIDPGGTQPPPQFKA
ncbi:MAG TPA: pilin [Candidatus Paceibacterota bacterium]